MKCPAIFAGLCYLGEEACGGNGVFFSKYPCAKLEFY